MIAIDSATARHRTYLLLSRLFLEGLTAELLPYIEKIPQLAAVCCSPYDAARAAAEHQKLFSFDIYPFESVFRDPEGLLGGPITDQLLELYRRSNYQCDQEAGHIGHELAFMAQLCQEKARALTNHDRQKLLDIVERQQEMIQSHILQWLPVLVIALSFSRHPFYSEIGRLTLSLIGDHAQKLELQYAATEQDTGLPTPPEIWNDPQTRLKTIANYLTTPPYSGFYLGREGIAALARNAQLPRGFGSRRQMLTNLFHSASHYDTIPDLLAQLAALASQWQESFQLQIDEHPQLMPWITPWKNRAQSSAESLTKMGDIAMQAV